MLSAGGFLVAPLAFDFVRTRRALVDELDAAEIEALFAELEAEGEALLRGSGATEISHRRSAELRYVGQGHELRVDVPPGGPAELADAFTRAYRGRYGHEGPDVPVEALNWRVVSSGPRPRLRLDAAARRDRRRRRPASATRSSAASASACRSTTATPSPPERGSTARRSSRSASRRS